jgi:hypothetical protein
MNFSVILPFQLGGSDIARKFVPESGGGDRKRTVTDCFEPP